jgi:hypothetical protein
MSTRPNQRRYMRTRAQNLVAHLRVGDQTIQAPVEDISMGGLLARTVESVPIGTALMFDLARPGLKRPLRLLGVVVDNRLGRGIGIRFDGLDRETNDRLSELIGAIGGMTSSLLADRPDHPEPRREPARTEAPPTPRPPASDGEQKLQAQLRSMVMELGRLQELVQGRERELHDARAEIERLRASASAAEAAQQAAQNSLGRLEIEKGRVRAELEAMRKEAELAAGHLARVLEALGHLR